MGFGNLLLLDFFKPADRRGLHSITPDVKTRTYSPCVAFQPSNILRVHFAVRADFPEVISVLIIQVFVGIVVEGGLI